MAQAWKVIIHTHKDVPTFESIKVYICSARQFFERYKGS